MPSPSTICRLLPNPPSFGGIPAHQALLLLGCGLVGYFAGQLVNATVGIVIAATIAVIWLVLGFITRQDQAAVPMWLLRRLYGIPRAVTSYQPSQRRVRIVERGEE